MIDVKKHTRWEKEKNLFEKTPSPYFGKREWFMEEGVVVMKQGFFIVGFKFPKRYPFYAPVAKLMRPASLAKEFDLYKPAHKWSPQNKLVEVFDDYLTRFIPELTKMIDRFEKNYILFFGGEGLPTDIKNLVFDTSILLILG